MPVYISLLRGINVGGNKLIKMDALKALYAALGFDRPRTLLQSGNVVFSVKGSDQARLEKRIAGAIAQEFGFEVEIVLRSVSQWQDVIARSPFARRKLDPSRLVVMFLARKPDPEGLRRLLAADIAPEEIVPGGQELYIHYPNGIGRSKLGKVPMEKLLKVPGTARNWNTVTKLFDLAQG